MVQGPNNLPKFRDIKNQIHALEHAVKALRPEHALAWVAGHGNVPVGYTSLVAVSKLDNFGSLSIPATSEAWGKVTGWRMQTRIPGLVAGTSNLFDPAKFSVEERTHSAFAGFEAQAVIENKKYDLNRMRIFPVRISTEPEPVLEEDEFFLDLVSMMWLLVSHPKWKVSEGEFLLRCLGERYLDHRTLLVGYRDSVRKVTYHNGEQDTHPTIIGKVLS